MSEQQKKKLENTMNLQAEAQAAEARGQQLAMEKSEEKAEEIAQEVADGTKKVYQAIEKGVVSGYMPTGWLPDSRWTRTRIWSKM